MQSNAIGVHVLDSVHKSRQRVHSVGGMWLALRPVCYIETADACNQNPTYLLDTPRGSNNNAGNLLLERILVAGDGLATIEEGDLHALQVSLEPLKFVVNLRRNKSAARGRDKTVLPSPSLGQLRVSVRDCSSAALEETPPQSKQLNLSDGDIPGMQARGCGRGPGRGTLLPWAPAAAALIGQTLLFYPCPTWPGRERPGRELHGECTRAGLRWEMGERCRC